MRTLPPNASLPCTHKLSHELFCFSFFFNAALRKKHKRAQLVHNKVVDHCAVSFSSNESENCEVGSPICCGNLSKDLQALCAWRRIAGADVAAAAAAAFPLELCRRHTSTPARHKQRGRRREKKPQQKTTTSGVSLPATQEAD